MLQKWPFIRRLLNATTAAYLERRGNTDQKCSDCEFFAVKRVDKAIFIQCRHEVETKKTENWRHEGCFF